jgi:hypothetical protein
VLTWSTIVVVIDKMNHPELRRAVEVLMWNLASPGESGVDEPVLEYPSIQNRVDLSDDENL